MKFVACVLLWSASLPVFAELTIDQRVADFQQMAALYEKRYAPYEWKRQAFGFDMFDLRPWLDRIRAAKSDVEFLEISAEYVASLQDTHSSFTSPLRFTADLGFTVDIYDGKVLIDSINRARLPQTDYPFEVGDEVLSVDGKTPEQWITEFSRFRKWGNPATTRRSAADRITFRSAASYPRAIETGDSAAVQIQRANGDTESYTIPWTKTGLAQGSLGTVPTPRNSRPIRGEESAPDYMRLLAEMRQWKIPDSDSLFEGQTTDEDGNTVARKYVLGLGSRSPVFALPAGFQQRLGRSTDFHYSGVYESNGYKIGYLRVPAFSTNPTSLRELDQEIAFFRSNTDGLVVDVMRNGGGDCYMLTLASYLIPQNNFYFFGEELRPTLGLINSFQSAIDLAKRSNADQWIITLYSNYLDQLLSAFNENRGLTGSIPACSISFENRQAQDRNGNALAYDKPLIVLVDDFSISAADIFPAMMQDNKRGPIVGMRTSGGGGSISTWPMSYSESIFANTNSLVVRKNPITTADLPSAPFVENIGTRPDIQLDYMTRENLLNRGRPFVEGFTRIIVDQIQASRQ